MFAPRQYRRQALTERPGSNHVVPRHSPPAALARSPRRAAVRADEGRPFHPHRLIPRLRGDRSPRSPEARRTPSGSHPGAFCFRRSQGSVHAPKGDDGTDHRKTTSALKHPAAPRPRQGRPRAALRMRCALMLRHGRTGDRQGLNSIRVHGTHTHDRLATAGHTKHRHDRLQRYGFQAPSGARGYAGSVCRACTFGVSQRR